MDISEELIEALDAVAFTWSKPRTADSQLNAQQAGVHLLDQLAVDYDHLGTADQVVPELIDELMARETIDGGEWHRRAAALGSVVEGVVQAKASEQARDN